MRLEIRSARPGDYGVFVALYPELGTGDAIPDESTWTESMMSTTVVATVAGQPRGYLFYRFIGQVGRVVHLVVERSARRCGAGNALMTHVRNLFVERGATRWNLNVKPDNSGAIALYRSHGFLQKYESAVIRMTWDQVAGLEPSSAEGAVVSASDDREFEERFALLEGQLESARQQRGRVVLGVRDPQPVGIALFTPDFPNGAFPFRVADPRYLRALLEEMRRHGRADVDELQVVSDDDPAVRQALESIGGRLHMVVHNYEGLL